MRKRCERTENATRRPGWHDMAMRVQDTVTPSPGAWLLWLVAAFLGSFELAWWAIWNLLKV